MNVDQQERIFAHLMNLNKVTQTTMGFTSHTLPDPASGICYNGRYYNLDDAIRLLNIQIAGAKLEHERNERAIADAISYLDKMGGGQ